MSFWGHKNILKNFWKDIDFVALWGYNKGARKGNTRNKRKKVKTMKRYEVKVLEGTFHGRKKEAYTAWLLEAKNKEVACSFALEILAGMTWNELEDEAELNGSKAYKFWHNSCIVEVGETFKVAHFDRNAIINYEDAENLFTIKAEVFKG